MESGQAVGLAKALLFAWGFYPQERYVKDNTSLAKHTYTIILLQEESLREYLLPSRLLGE